MSQDGIFWIFSYFVVSSVLLMSLFLSSEKISEFYASAGIREVINF